MAIDIRYWARLAMPKAIADGISRNRFIGMIKETYGKAYRRQDVLKDWSEMSGIPEKTDRLKYVRKGYKPSAATITRTHGVQKQLYVYHYEITGYDRIQQVEIKSGMAVASMNLLTMDEALQLVMENQDWYNPEVDISNIDILKITQPF